MKIKLRLCFCAVLAITAFSSQPAFGVSFSGVKRVYNNIPSHQKSLVLGLALLGGGISINAIWGDKQNELKNKIALLKRKLGFQKNRKLEALIRKMQLDRAGYIGLQVVAAIMDLGGSLALINAYNQWGSSTTTSS
jgi:hypothetical protein